MADLASIIAQEEDRISNFPYDIILHILGFLDMKYVIQTSTLSKRWKPIWTLIPKLNFNDNLFHTRKEFKKFTLDALSHRDNSRQVYEVDTSFKVCRAKGVERIVTYAYLHNVQRLTGLWFAKKRPFELPYGLFSSRTLKHLTLAATKKLACLFISGMIHVPFDFPALETLSLENMKIFGKEGDLNVDLFSKCVNLKELELNKCDLYCIEVFNVCAPQLSNLTITDSIWFPEVLNVVAPQLKSLTASVRGPVFLEGLDSVRLSTNAFDSLEKVSLFSSNPKYNKKIHNKKRYVSVLLNWFRKVCSAKFLVLNMDIIETLSLGLDKLSHEPCPFDNLKSLTITQGRKKCGAIIPTQVINYLLVNSPDATFVVDLPQVPRRISRELLHTDVMAKKLYKLERRKRSWKQKKETRDSNKTNTCFDFV